MTYRSIEVIYKFKPDHANEFIVCRAYYTVPDDLNIRFMYCVSWYIEEFLEAEEIYDSLEEALDRVDELEHEYFSKEGLEVRYEN